jgi:nucleoside-diphosphate-sugar epimerase
MTLERFLVTGASGCLGSWVVAQLVGEGIDVVALDANAEHYRLQLLLPADQLAQVQFIQGDVCDTDAIGRIIARERISNIIHLAALQVPFCRADPIHGALVNVVGTVSIFEAVQRANDRIRSVVYASSTGIYGRADRRDGDALLPAGVDAHPENHYGVYKMANEGTARVYWLEGGLPSIGLRPYVVYGVGRDQGMSASPSLAMLAAVVGRPYQISFGGRFQFHYAPDAARAFIQASRAEVNGALILNLNGPVVHMRDVVEAIWDAAPEARGKIDFDDVSLGLPEGAQSDGLEETLGPLRVTPLRAAVAETIDHLRARTYSQVGRDADVLLEITSH